jgi:hypothetical protein
MVLLTFAILMCSVFVPRVKAAQTCHPNCAPFSCHGPTEYNCDDCAGNMVLEIDKCVCKPGWFSVTATCDTYVPNCKTIQILSGVVSCTQCESLRDTLSGGSCTRSTLPFFIRSSSSGYTGSATDKTDGNYFLANQCMSLNGLGKCLECYPGGIVQASGTCLYPATNCYQTDSSGKCLQAKPYFYLISSAVPSFGYCIGSCKTCTDGRFGRCKSCAPGNYFQLNSGSTVLGNCYPCHPSCYTCTGPLTTDCSTAYIGSFIERSDLATYGTSTTCASNCDLCTSLTNCQFCKFKLISVDGVCSSTINTIATCVYQYTYSANSSTLCLRYPANAITGSDYKSYTVTSSDATSRCLVYDFPTDRITIRCKSCVSNYIPVNNICVYVSTSAIPLCANSVTLTPTSVLCLECPSGSVLSTPKSVCGSGCGALETAVILTSISSLCSPCPEYCSACVFSASALKCTECNANFVLYKDQCMSTSCGDGIITLNKECDPVLSPSTCTIDCLNMLSGECLSNADCTRNVFGLVSTDPGIVSLLLLPRYADQVDFAVQSDIIYDSTDPTAQKFFCGRLIPELNDPAAVCLFDSVGKTIKAKVSTNTMRYLSTKPSTVIIPQGLVVTRKYISQLAFKLGNSASVTISAPHISKSFVITTPPVVPLNEDLVMSYELLDPSVCVSTASFTATAATINGVSQTQALTDVNNALATGTIATRFAVPAAKLIADLVIAYNLQLVFCDGSSSTITSSSTVASSNIGKMLLLAAGSNIAVLGGNEPIELLFDVKASPFDVSQLIVNIAGNLAGMSEFSVQYISLNNKLVLTLTPVTSLNSFLLELGYSGYLSEYVFLKRAEQYLYPAISLSVAYKISQSITFWTSAGPDFQFRSYCFSKRTGQKLFSTAAVNSYYSNNLNQSVTSQDTISLQLIFTRGALSVIFAFDISIEAGTAPSQSLFNEMVLTTMYRDGSILTSSSNQLSWGFPTQNWVNNLQLPATSSATIRTASGQSSLQLSLSTIGNKILASPVLPSTISSRPSSVILNIAYIESTGTSRQSRFVLPVYTPPQLSLVCNELSGNFGFYSKFTLTVAITPVVDIYNMHDGRQHQATVVLSYSTGSKIPAALVPIMIPSTKLYSVQDLHAVIWKSAPSATLPNIGAVIYDFNSFSQASTSALQTSRSWPGSSAADCYQDWDSGLTARSTSADPDTYMNLLAHLVFELNQLYLGCQQETWCTAQTTTALSASRWTLLASFKQMWNGINDKVSFLNWPRAILKSTILNGLTLDPNNVADADVDWLAQELKRETGLMFAYAQSSRLKFTRISFGLVESLKPLLTLTLFNLDQHTSALSHAFQMYVMNYRGFATADACMTILNQIYRDLMGLNELRLIRYTHISTTSFYQNQLLMAGGITLTEPLPASQVMWVGEKIAVEIKNLRFDPTLDSYEMSVIILKDSFFDSLTILLDKFNLTSSLNKSRTSVGFTNQFQLVYPKLSNDTEINIYRSPDECRGTPCNLNKQLTSSSTTIILCECLSQSTPTVVNVPKTSPPVTPSSTGPLNNFTDTLGNTVTGLGKTASSGAKCLFGTEENCIENKKVWINSVTTIFMIMTVMSLIACLTDSSILSPKALKFAAESRISMAITNHISATETSTQDARLRLAEEDGLQRNPVEGLSRETPNSSDSVGNLLANFPKQQAGKISALLQRLPEEEVPKNLLSRSVLTPMSTAGKFWIVGLLTHSITSIFTSQCKLHSRKTTIFLLYLRSVYELALSMFFTLGIDQSSTGYAQKFAVRCFFSILIVGFIAPIIKKLARSDNEFGMSAVWCSSIKNTKSTARKMSEETNQTIADKENPTKSAMNTLPMVRPPFKIRNRSWTNQNNHPRSIQKVSPANSIVLNDRQLDRKAGTDHAPDRQSSIQSLIPAQSSVLGSLKNCSTDNNRPLPPATQNTEFHRVRIWLGYLIMYFLLIASVLVILSISKANDESGNWPFGYWYVFQFTISSTLGSVPSILLQYVCLVWRIDYINKQASIKRRISSTSADPSLHWIARQHFFLNNDVYRLTELIELELKQEPKPYSEKELQIDMPLPAQESPTV